MTVEKQLFEGDGETAGDSLEGACQREFARYLELMKFARKMAYKANAVGREGQPRAALAGDAAFFALLAKETKIDFGATKSSIVEGAMANAQAQLAEEQLNRANTLLTPTNASKDYVEGFVWVHIADANGHENAPLFLNNPPPGITQQQLDEATVIAEGLLAEEFRPAH